VAQSETGWSASPQPETGWRTATEPESLFAPPREDDLRAPAYDDTYDDDLRVPAYDDDLLAPDDDLLAPAHDDLNVTAAELQWLRDTAPPESRGPVSASRPRPRGADLFGTATTVAPVSGGPRHRRASAPNHTATAPSHTATAPSRSAAAPSRTTAAPSRGGLRGGLRGGRTALMAVWFAGLIGAVVLWHNGPPLAGTGDIVTAAGRVVGLVAGYALLTQLVLSARLSSVERIAGPETLMRWHRDIGALLVFSVITHMVLITKGYALVANLPLIDQGLTMAQTMEDMLSAFGATAIIVAVGLVSIRQLRRYLPYEVWHIIHRTSYLALLFGYGHQFTSGQDVAQGIGWAYWVTLHIGVVAAVVWGRLGAPLMLNLYHQLEVAEVVEEGPGVVSVYVTGRRLDELPARAGQYARWRFLAPGCWSQSHPFSLSAPPNGEWLRITVKAVGDFTSRVRNLTPGARVWMSAPSGEHTSASRVTNKTLLIAAGSGIAPARALLSEVPPGAILVYRASSVEDLVLRAELEEVARSREAQLWYVVGSRNDPGPRRLLTAGGLANLVPDVAERDVYLCGPPEFAQAVTRALRKLQVPNNHLHISAFEL
jgi:predicted ferric reductase